MKHVKTIAIVASVLTCLYTVTACQPASTVGREEIQGKVLQMQDLYSLEKTPYSGFYQQLRQVSIDQQIVYIPLTGNEAISTANDLKLAQTITVEVDHNRIVRQLSIQHP